MFVTADRGKDAVELHSSSHRPERASDGRTRDRQGRHAAFAAIVTEHDARLRTLAYQLLGSRDAMDDVLQDVYIKAYRGLDSYRGEAAMGTWLHRITYTTCIDRLRRATCTEPLSEEAAEAYGARDSDPDDDLALGEELHRALSTLDAEHRAAVLLVLREGYSYQDAGEILGIPRGTVASRVARAREVLVRSLSASQEGGRS